jgi:hypothetical protein
MPRTSIHETSTIFQISHTNIAHISQHSYLPIKNLSPHSLIYPPPTYPRTFIHLLNLSSFPNIDKQLATILDHRTMSLYQQNSKIPSPPPSFYLMIYKCLHNPMVPRSQTDLAHRISNPVPIQVPNSAIPRADTKHTLDAPRM